MRTIPIIEYGLNGMQNQKSGGTYFEHLRLGNYYKIVAIDANTGVEVTVMGPANGNIKRLEDIALRKLNMRLEKGH